MPKTKCIGLLTRKLIAFSQAVTPRTVKRWQTTGRFGVKLEAEYIDGEFRSTPEQLADFLRKSFGGDPGAPVQLLLDFDTTASDVPAVDHEPASEQAVGAEAVIEVGRGASAAPSAEIGGHSA